MGEWGKRRKARSRDRLNHPQLQTGKENSVKNQPVIDPPVALYVFSDCPQEQRSPAGQEIAEGFPEQTEAFSE